MGDITGLLETVADLNLTKNKDFIENLKRGVFTIADMKEQLLNIMKMGPLSKVVGMIPGIPPELLGSGSDEQGARQLKRLLCIMDSMTLQGTVQIGLSQSSFGPFD